MNLYEHTIIARQDTSPSEIKQLTEKYSKIVEKNEGEIVKTENWGLLNLSYLIKKNKKGSYIHFKIKGKGNVVDELEKNEAIDKKLLRYLTVRVKKFDLDKFFKAKISGADLKESKPNPEIFIKAAKLSGFSKSECIVIEDSTNGIIAAKSAGIYCIGFNSPNSKNQIYDKDDLFVSNFHEIYDLCNKHKVFNMFLKANNGENSNIHKFWLAGSSQ